MYMKANMNTKSFIPRDWAFAEHVCLVIHALSVQLTVTARRVPLVVQLCVVVLRDLEVSPTCVSADYLLTVAWTFKF